MTFAGFQGQTKIKNFEPQLNLRASCGEQPSLSHILYYSPTIKVVYK